MGPGRKEVAMKRKDAAREAERIAAAIGRNVEAVHAREIPWETFSERNGALWREAEVHPLVVAMVAAILRRDPNWKKETVR
jgi:hypothetical protein